MIPSRVQQGWQLLKYFGPAWLAYRLGYSARLKSGLFRWQLPATTWDRQPLSSFLKDPALADCECYASYRQNSAPRFFFDTRQSSEFQPLLAQWDRDEVTPVTESEKLAEGRVRFFSHDDVDVGMPPRWHADPLSKTSFPQDRHWSRIGDFQAGDIKTVWEINRFAFVYGLVRSYWRTADERYPQLFWQMIDDWFESNPPQTGVNWKCGQEISLRVMAWCFGLYGFLRSPSSSAARIGRLAQMIAVSGRRIRANIAYGLSQKNNHGISEAMGLWSIGILFPEFKESGHWAAVGRHLLERQGRELVYDDGSFSQSSMNYHRVMLHDYLWSMRLADIQAQPFSDELRERIGRSGEFLYQLQDEFTGSVPCYGQDDGALILPLNNCAYQDYRPIVQSINYLTASQRRIEAGPWDEDLLWLFGSSAVPNSKRRQNDNGSKPSTLFANRIIRFDSQMFESTLQHPHRNFDASDGGYSTLRSASGFASIRAARFKHRPSQADQLHLDIWWRGENIAIDPGSFSYNAPPPWNNPFAHTDCHNTVVVDGRDQMDRVGRFLWLPWASGKSFGRVVPLNGDVSAWHGEHDGYRRLNDPVVHRRGVIRIGAEHWLVVDALSADHPHQYGLNWLLMDAPYDFNAGTKTIDLQTSSGPYRVAMASSESTATVDLVRADANSARGWRSRFYQSREPALSVHLQATTPTIVLATALGPDVESPVIQDERILLKGPGWELSTTLLITDKRSGPLIDAIEVAGSLLNPYSPIHNFQRRSMQELQKCTYY